MTVRAVISATSVVHGLAESYIMSHRRHPRYVAARHEAMYVARLVLGMSFPELGRAFDRDHTTVLDGFRRVESSLPHNQERKERVERICVAIQSTGEPSREREIAKIRSLMMELRMRLSVLEAA